jgi:hypothetical protein
VYGTVLWGHSAFFKNPNRELRDAKERKEEEERLAEEDALSLSANKEKGRPGEVD